MLNGGAGLYDFCLQIKNQAIFFTLKASNKNRKLGEKKNIESFILKQKISSQNIFNILLHLSLSFINHEICLKKKKKVLMLNYF